MVLRLPSKVEFTQGLLMLCSYVWAATPTAPCVFTMEIDRSVWSIKPSSFSNLFLPSLNTLPRYSKKQIKRAMTAAGSTQNAYTIMFLPSLHTLSQYSKITKEESHDRCWKHAKSLCPQP
jgi:hypothetical protein